MAKTLLTVYIDPNLKEQCKKLLDKKNISYSKFVEVCMQNFINKEKEDKDGIVQEK